MPPRVLRWLLQTTSDLIDLATARLPCVMMWRWFANFRFTSRSAAVTCFIVAVLSPESQITNECSSQSDGWPDIWK